MKSPPKNALVNASIVPARSAKVMPRSIDQALDLVEHRHVRGVGRVAAEHPAGHRRCRSAAAVVCITRICTGEVWVRSTVVPGSPPRWSTNSVSYMLRAGWPGRHVERLEVVPVALDLGALGDREAEADEHVLEALPRLGDEVGVAATGRARRTR